MFDDLGVPLFVLSVLWWLAAGIAVGMAAEARGRRKGAWLGIGLLLGPIAAPLILLCYPPVTQEDAERFSSASLSITQ